jgi:two-component sensor histidine kinase
MALIHEKLYRSANVAEIDFGEYLRELAVYLFRSYGARKKGIELSTDVRPVAMGIDRAIPCGLIVNELITNSLKYAFPGVKTGKVFLRLQVPAPHTVQLIVGDTGVGIPEGFDVTKTDSLGLKLVTMLTKQLEGTLALESNGDGRESARGAQFTITFRA